MTADIPVKEIMTREVCTVSKDESVLNVSRKMIECGVGSVVVVEDSKPIGIVTERDIILKVVARDKIPSEVCVEEIMNYPVVTVTPETSAKQAGRIMLKKGIRRLPVVKGDSLVGIVTDTDLLSFSIDLGEYMGLIREENYVVEEVETGKCEKCGKIAELFDADGLKVCEDCFETI